MSDTMEASAFKLFFKKGMLILCVVNTSGLVGPKIGFLCTVVWQKEPQAIQQGVGAADSCKTLSIESRCWVSLLRHW